MRKFALPTLLLQSTTLVTPKSCCKIKLLKLNTPNLQKGQHTLHEIKLRKINILLQER